MLETSVFLYASHTFSYQDLICKTDVFISICSKYLTHNGNAADQADAVYFSQTGRDIKNLSCWKTPAELGLLS